ncbi:MAG TPA: hypothetical protein VFY75_05545 [Solirubrobacterales bacterium]|nr:hypothetical protein [Solirubrobacterales bacterium]
MAMQELRTDSQQQPSLEGPLAKLRRAHTHLTELYDELNLYTSEENHHVVSDFVDEGDVRIYTMRIEVTKPLGNPTWGLLAGDFVHNLRGALDHLVWQLVLLNGERPTRANQFPICTTSDRYWDRDKKQPSVRERTLTGVAEPHRQMIDSVQPFLGPVRDELHLDYHPLSVLARLSNMDKHQLITSAFVNVGEIDEGMFNIVTSDGSGVGLFEVYQHALFEDRTEIGQLEMHGVRPDLGIKIDVNLPLEIGFGYPRGIRSDGFGMLYEFVRDFVKGFRLDFEVDE